MIFVKNMSFTVPFCTHFVQNCTSTVLKALLCNYEAARLNSYNRAGIVRKWIDFAAWLCYTEYNNVFYV